MNDDPDYTGPSEATLRALRDTLPSFTKGIVEKKAVGKGIKVRIKPAPLVPSRYCAVCTRLFDFIQSFEGQLTEGLCESCNKTLEEGHIALIADDKSVATKTSRKFMFINRKFLKTPNLNAKVIRIPMSEFLDIEKHRDAKPS